MDKEKSRGGGTHLKAPKSSVPDDLWDDLPLFWASSSSSYTKKIGV